MPHQKYLQETGREFAHGSRLRSALTWLAVLICLVALGFAVRYTQSAPSAADEIPFVSIEAVRAEPLDQQAGIDIVHDQPPALGWVDVTLPDTWTARWPDFDGVVWYRLTWNQDDTDTPIALTMDYANMASALYLNGTLLRRDEHLAEPLSRAWNMPHLLLLPGPLVHQGLNSVLIRVSSMGMYSGGLGPVTIGAPLAMRQRYAHAYLIRQTLQLSGLVVSATLGCFFLALWLMRRKETVHGWFIVISLAWLIVSINQVVTSPYPFASTDHWEIANSIALIAFFSSNSIFLLRFCQQRWPRYERVLWVVTALSCMLLILTPHPQIETMRALTTVTLSLNYFASNLVFVIYAWRRGNTLHRTLGFCSLAFIMAGVHDMLTFLGYVTDNTYYTTPSAQLLMIGMAFVLARQVVNNLTQIEAFNEQLALHVEEARRELAETLQCRHALEVVDARLSERSSLAHDIHDGLGGTLVSNIAALEHTPQGVPPQRFLAILKELRDDLRVIIDSASNQQYGDVTLDRQLAPIRRRLGQLFDAHDVDCRWDTTDIDQCVLPAAQSMNVMRILQEALTNVFKHSHATQVKVTILYDGHNVDLTVWDDGIGFNTDTDPGDSLGTGMRSMRARAQRLNAKFVMTSTPGSTLIALHFPVGDRQSDITASGSQAP